MSGERVIRALADQMVSQHRQRAADQLEEARQRRYLLRRRATRANADRRAAELLPINLGGCKGSLDG
jgi:hypothetical protein